MKLHGGVVAAPSLPIGNPTNMILQKGEDFHEKVQNQNADGLRPGARRRVTK